MHDLPRLRLHHTFDALKSFTHIHCAFCLISEMAWFQLMFKSFLRYVEAFSHLLRSLESSPHLHESSVTIPLLNEASIPAAEEPGFFSAVIVTFCVSAGDVNLDACCPVVAVTTASLGFEIKLISPLPPRVMLAVMTLLSFP